MTCYWTVASIRANYRQSSSEHEIGLWKISGETTSFILSCSRLTAVSSQTLEDALEPNFSDSKTYLLVLSVRSFKSQKKIDIDFVNFLFLYLVPSGLLLCSVLELAKKSAK